ncbi:hypothetical protein M011DRAFT_405151 [Sporormia fimetaria CBS 119925]|uniref:Uncharacterized protein n=1 Tax=Sporormia fimetaria CBS 119925 TaxID=1340428 RepID=A0A6A6VA93_9PLEO|nr:hypothetical protein M011DRAFT_405151 [Sporormia fimetaria CBS 119925]
MRDPAPNSPKPLAAPPNKAPVPAHSKPVVIPPRTPTKTLSHSQTVRLRGHHGGRRTRTLKSHQPDAIPPAVAALLAVTEIPRMPPRVRKGSRASNTRRVSMDELIREWNRDDSELSPSSIGSPLDVLLGRVYESEDEYGSLQSLEQEKGFLSARSMSSGSLNMMLPSLETDHGSFASNWDDVPTPESIPESYGRPERTERKEKTVQSPPKEDCVLDHPLLHFTQEECDEIAKLEAEDLVEETPSPLSGKFQSLKSNLTASFQAMKSAAKSFSNFTAPTVPPDDLLTRSLLSPRFTSEMRPKQMNGVPSAALRRYLNPQPPSISPAELSMQLHAAFTLDVDTDTSAPMIQMQTYDRRASRSPSRKRKNDPFSEAGRIALSSPAVRQREPRENSDFLRVIVLEMNMRRVGKLDAKASGKARIWLPPRKASASAVVQRGRDHVPQRWIAEVACGD